MLRKNTGIAIALVACASVGVAYLTKTAAIRRYIFINESTDHRFDESIRISILAASNRSGVQNAVVITDNVESGTLEEKSAKLFSELRVGEQQKGRGILFLYSPAKSLLKIEVAYALEGVLPDVTVKGLELAAKTFIFHDRYQDFWAELINTLNIEVYEKEHGLRDGGSNFDFSKFAFLSGGAGIASRSYQPTLQQLVSESRAKTADQSFRAGLNPAESVEAYLTSLSQGIGDPDLDVLSSESQVFRRVTPLTTYQLYRNWKMYQKAGMDRTFTQGNLSFFFFKPNHPVLPIVLRKERGKWRVQEPMSWSLFHRFEDSMRVFLKFPISGISSELLSYLNTNLGKPLYPLVSPIEFRTIERWDSHIPDAFSLYFQLFWLTKVEEQIGWPGSGDPLVKVWIAADTFLNLGKMSQFAKIYQEAANRLPGDSGIQKNAKFYRELIQFKDAEWRSRI